MTCHVRRSINIKQTPMTPPIFNGVIPWEDEPSAAGIATVRNPSGHWQEFSSGNEQQYDQYMDTDNCTGFSFTRVTEAFINRLISLQLLSASTLLFLSQNGYLNGQGKVEFSERALGAMAGTTQNGNSFPNVYNAASTKGLIPNSKWSWDYNQEKDYPTYYAIPPADLLALGQQFLNHFTFDKQPIAKADMDACLPISPLWIAIPVCDWSSATPQYDGHSTVMQHAVNIDQHTPAGFQIEDDYNPYIKTLSPDYFIPAIWNVTVMPKEQNMYLASDHGTVYLVAGVHNKTKIGIADTDSLALFGDEPIIPEDTSAIPQTTTLSKGFSVHNK
jgi:hypothetical protein